MKTNKQKLFENKIRSLVKEVLNEAEYDPNSKEYKLKSLSDFFKAMYEYCNNREKNLDVDWMIGALEKQIVSLKKYKNNQQ